MIAFPNEKLMPGSILEVYYLRSHKEWLRVYNGTEDAATLGIFVYTSNKLALYSWNFADILLILFSRALYFKFKMLNEVAAQRLIDREQVLNGRNRNRF